MLRRETRKGAPGSLVLRVNGLAAIAFSGWFGIFRFVVHRNNRAAAFTWPTRLSALSSEVTGLVTVVTNIGPRLRRLPRRRGTGPGTRLGNRKGTVDVGVPGWQRRGICDFSRLRPVPSLLRCAPHRMWRRSHWWNHVARATCGADFRSEDSEVAPKCTPMYGRVGDSVDPGRLNTQR